MYQGTTAINMLTQHRINRLYSLYSVEDTSTLDLKVYVKWYLAGWIIFFLCKVCVYLLDL